MFLMKVDDECRRERGISIGSSLSSNNRFLSSQNMLVANFRLANLSAASAARHYLI